MNTTLINEAMTKFPKAKRIAVVNFTMEYDELSIEAAMNLSADTASYNWNANTVNAIRYVIRQKHMNKKRVNQTA